jgi:hypothetical protein
MVTDGPCAGFSSLFSRAAAQRVTMLLKIMSSVQRLSFNVAQFQDRCLDDTPSDLSKGNQH